ncbi:MAG: hypothetical protein ABW128_00145 [Rhizorhabdus sp.]
MRVAVMIIALCLTMILGVQSCAITAGGALLGDEGTSGAGSMGLLLALIYVVGAAFSWGFPRFAGTLFLAGGVLALLASANSLYGDLAIWGSVSIGLAVMAFLGAREVRRPMPPMPYQQMPPHPLQHQQGQGIERQPAPLLLPAPEGMQPYAAPPYLPPNPARRRRNQLIAAGVVAVVLVGLSLGVFTTGANPIASVLPAPASTSGAQTTATPQPRAVMVDDPAAKSSDSSAPVMAVDAPEAPPRVTRAWLVGTWGPNLGAGAGSACDTDGVVTFEASGRYRDGGSRGRFATDGETITYFNRIMVDMAEGTEDMSKYDTPLRTAVEAIDSDTMREEGDLWQRCTP